jgi:hypothetical protein
VPKSAHLYSEKDLTSDFTPVDYAKALIVNTERLYWADEYGELYRMDDKTGFLYPIFSFDYAFVGDELFYSTDTRYSDTGELLPIGSGTRVKR